MVVGPLICATAFVYWTCLLVHLYLGGLSMASKCAVYSQRVAFLGPGVDDGIGAPAQPTSHHLRIARIAGNESIF